MKMDDIIKDIASTIRMAVKQGIETLVEPKLSLLQARIDDLEKRLKDLEVN